MDVDADDDVEAELRLLELFVSFAFLAVDATVLLPSLMEIKVDCVDNKTGNHSCDRRVKKNDDGASFRTSSFPPSVLVYPTTFSSNDSVPENEKRRACSFSLFKFNVRYLISVPFFSRLRKTVDKVFTTSSFCSNDNMVSFIRLSICCCIVDGLEDKRIFFYNYLGIIFFVLAVYSTVQGNLCVRKLGLHFLYYFTTIYSPLFLSTVSDTDVRIDRSIGRSVVRKKTHQLLLFIKRYYYLISNYQTQQTYWYQPN
mmetsp:Transcript_44435/g.107483  ORF Transcript_44435/g.107483 Transcript_44435/m.107483 type:complete len:255 (-) Transcript_44435:1660-2424(-)